VTWFSLLEAVLNQKTVSTLADAAANTHNALTSTRTGTASMNLDFWRHYLRAVLSEKLRRYDAALADYRAALAIDPRSARAQHALAFLFARQQRWREAEPCFREALRLDPDNADLWFNLGFVCEKLDEPMKAIDAFRRAVERDRKLDRAWYGLGLRLAALGDHAEACKALREAADLQPMNGFAWYHLGMAYHALGNVDKVTEVAKHMNRFDRKLTRQLVLDSGREDLRKLVADMKP
jgi:tetratricopeptide (TPR) repeat protein